MGYEVFPVPGGRPCHQYLSRYCLTIIKETCGSTLLGRTLCSVYESEPKATEILGKSNVSGPATIAGPHKGTKYIMSRQNDGTNEALSNKHKTYV